MSRPDLVPAAVSLLACPVCEQPLGANGAGLACPVGHSFDRSRQGHVTLLPAGSSVHPGDSAEMVADRAEFLAAGHYRGLTGALADAVLAPGQSGPSGPSGAPATLVDAGGGTGAHLAGVLDRAPAAVGVVLDVSRYAARRAARAHPRAIAVVADTWARWPVRTGTVDRVLVVFAPRNGAETARVLRPGGRLVVVTPAADHLAELIGPLGLLSVDPAKADRLAASLEPHLRPVAAATYREELLLDRAAVRTLVGMGPHARHRTSVEFAAGVDRLAEPVRVTLSVDVTTHVPG